MAFKSKWYSLTPEQISLLGTKATALWDLSVAASANVDLAVESITPILRSDTSQPMADLLAHISSVEVALNPNLDVVKLFTRTDYELSEARLIGWRPYQGGLQAGLPTNGGWKSRMLELEGTYPKNVCETIDTVLNHTTDDQRLVNSPVDETYTPT